MALSTILVGLSIISGLMAAVLALLGLYFEKNKKKSRAYLIWFVLLLAASFASIEYAFWLEGQYLFNLILGFNFPLISYFAIWFAFIIWLFETRKERKVWIIFFIALVILSLSAVVCPDCIIF